MGECVNCEGGIRDRFAMSAMNGMSGDLIGAFAELRKACSGVDKVDDGEISKLEFVLCRVMAREAYRVADAMMIERVLK